MPKRKESEPVGVKVKDQRITHEGEPRESVEEFLARGGKIEEVPIRSGDQILERLKQEGQHLRNRSMRKSEEDKAKDRKRKKEGP